MFVYEKCNFNTDTTSMSRHFRSIFRVIVDDQARVGKFIGWSTMKDLTVEIRRAVVTNEYIIEYIYSPFIYLCAVQLKCLSSTFGNLQEAR